MKLTKELLLSRQLFKINGLDGLYIINNLEDDYILCKVRQYLIKEAEGNYKEVYGNITEISYNLSKITKKHFTISINIFEDMLLSKTIWYCNCTVVE